MREVFGEILIFIYIANAISQNVFILVLEARNF